MAEEREPVLQEIAGLLRQQVEQTQRAQEYQEERYREQQEKSVRRMEQFRESFPKFLLPPSSKTDSTDKLPDFHYLREESQKHFDAMYQRQEEDRQERREFQARLLAEFERHNSVLERILERLTR